MASHESYEPMLKDPVENILDIVDDLPSRTTVGDKRNEETTQEQQALDGMLKLEQQNEQQSTNQNEEDEQHKDLKESIMDPDAAIYDRNGDIIGEETAASDYAAAECPEEDDGTSDDKPPPRKKRKYQRRRMCTKLETAIAAHKDAIEEEKSAQFEVEEIESMLEEAKVKHKEAQDRIEEMAENVIQVELQDDNEWNRMYRRLVEYKENNGNMYFSLTREEDDPELCELIAWVRKQRKNLSSGLRWSRKAALDRLGFVWDTYEATWAERYKELLEYRNEFGDCAVPHWYEEKPQLARWVQTQKKQYKNLKDGKKSHLTQERINMLESVGFVWESNSWNDKFQEFLAYKAEHNSVVIQKSGRYAQLGAWVQTQRSHYRFVREGKPSQLTPERIKLLDDAGFAWKLRGDWQERFQELLAYRAQTGTCIWSMRHGQDYPKLERWIRHQRAERNLLLRGKKSRIKPEQIRQLDEIGFVWDMTKEY